MSDKLTMLFINRWVGYNEGGIEAHVKDLAYVLAKRGHAIHVITTGEEALAREKAVVKVWKVPSRRAYYSYGMSGYFHASAYLLFAWLKFVELMLRGYRFDVVSVHFSLEAFLMRFVRAIFGVPYVMVFGGDTDFELREGRHATGRIQISKFMAKQCAAYGYEPLVIPKGVDAARFNAQVDGSRVRSRFVSGAERLILTVCRLEPRKDLSTLVSAAAIVCERDRRVKFVVVGDGVERRRLDDQIRRLGLSGRVILVGSVPYSADELQQYYAAADVFVLPTLYEGFGFVFAEAMACGLPIITTATGSNPEVVGDTGILVPVRRPDLLAAAVLGLLGDEARRSQMSETGLRKAQALTWERLVGKYEEAYRLAAQTRVSVGERIRLLGGAWVDLAIMSTRFFRDVARRTTRGRDEWLPTGQRGWTGSVLERGEPGAQDAR